MKVYTEVNYIWKDDKLVQTDSQSFDYEGELTQCHTKKFYGVNQPHAHGGEAGKVTSEINKMSDAATTNMQTVGLDKPGGDVKRFTDWIAKLDHEAQMIAWGHSSYNKDSPADTTDPEDLLKGSRRGLQGKNKKGKVEGEDKRRQPYVMRTDTLLTQGKYAKKLGPQ